MREFRFPVPPVCTGNWDEKDWDAWKARHGQWVETEPDTLNFLGHVWRKTKNRRGEALYRREEPYSEAQNHE